MMTRGAVATNGLRDTLPAQSTMLTRSLALALTHTRRSPRPPKSLRECRRSRSEYMRYRRSPIPQNASSGGGARTPRGTNASISRLRGAPRRRPTPLACEPDDVQRLLRPRNTSSSPRSILKSSWGPSTKSLASRILLRITSSPLSGTRTWTSRSGPPAGVYGSRTMNWRRRDERGRMRPPAER